MELFGGGVEAVWRWCGGCVGAECSCVGAAWRRRGGEAWGRRWGGRGGYSQRRIRVEICSVRKHSHHFGSNGPNNRRIIYKRYDECCLGLNGLPLPREFSTAYLLEETYLLNRFHPLRQSFRKVSCIAVSRRSAVLLSGSRDCGAVTRLRAMGCEPRSTPTRKGTPTVRTRATRDGLRLPNAQPEATCARACCAHEPHLP